MLTIFLLTLLAQQPQDPVRGAEMATRMVAATNHTGDEPQRSIAAHQVQEKQRFEKRFNEMVNALSAFTEAYNKDRGLVWPKKEADRLAIAMRELRECEAWKNYTPPLD